MSNTALALLIIDTIINDDKKPKKRRHKYWTKELYKKRAKSSHGNLLNEPKLRPPEDFKNILRINDETFNDLLWKVEQFIRKEDTFMRNAITPYQRLSATLRFLASGQSYEDLKFLTAIAPQTLGKIIPETCEAIIKVLKNEIKLPQTEDNWKEISQEFYDLWNFPNCLGAIDGKHVEITKPAESASNYYNYKKTFSIILMAIVNAKSEFLMVEIGANRGVSDGEVFSGTKFFRMYEEDVLNIPQPQKPPLCHENLPHVFVADDAFPLMENLMKPYSRSNLNKDQLIFNCRLSKARRNVENVFAILLSRFRILLTKINLSPDKCTSIVLACCYLHNFLRRKIGDPYVQRSDYSQQPNGTNNNQSLISLQPATSRNMSIEGKNIRNKYCEYFNTVGAVP